MGRGGKGRGGGGVGKGKGGKVIETIGKGREEDED